MTTTPAPGIPATLHRKDLAREAHRAETLRERVTRRGLAKHAAVILTAVGLDLDPGNPWGMAAEIARALGVKHTPSAGAWNSVGNRRSRKVTR